MSKPAYSRAYGGPLTRVFSSQAYYLRDEDTWTKINYTAQATTWMKPLQRGNPTGLVELPGNWYARVLL